MHPLHVALEAQIMTEQRLRHAAEQRRLRELTAHRPDLRDRVGAALVAVGTRLQHHRPARRPGAPGAVAR